MRTRMLLDLTHVYDEEGGVEDIAEDPNIYSDEASPTGEGPPEPLFFPGFALEIPDQMLEDANELESAARDDDAAPDGNARLTDRIPENRAFLSFLVEHGADIYADGFEVDYLETAETIGFEPKGPWTGYTSRNLAFFLNEDDARGYEQALRRYQEQGEAA